MFISYTYEKKLYTIIIMNRNYIILNYKYIKYKLLKKTWNPHGKSACMLSGYLPHVSLILKV